MSQIIYKVDNKNVIWNINLRARVGQTVTHNSTQFTNLTGKNSEPGVGVDWFLLDKGLSESFTDDVSGTHAIDWGFGNSNLTMTANTVFNEINLPPLGVEKTITIYLYGNFSPTDIIAWGIIGQPYDGVNGSQIVVHWKGDGTYHAVRNNLV